MSKLSQSFAELQADLNKIEATPEITGVGNGLIINASKQITADTSILSIVTETGYSIEFSMDATSYILTLNLKDKSGTTISTDNVDLPLESVVVGGRYDSTSKSLILTLKNEREITIPVGDLISGLQKEITTTNKLSSDLVDDTDKTNQFVTAAEKAAWNGKQDALTEGYGISIVDGVISVNLANAVGSSF